MSDCPHLTYLSLRDFCDCGHVFAVHNRDGDCEVCKFVALEPFVQQVEHGSVICIRSEHAKPEEIHRLAQGIAEKVGHDDFTIIVEAP